VCKVLPFARGPDVEQDAGVREWLDALGPDSCAGQSSNTLRALLLIDSVPTSESTSEDDAVVALLGTVAQLRRALGPNAKDLRPVPYGRGLDIARLQHVMPYAVTATLDMKRIMSVSADNSPDRMQRVIALDTLLIEQQGRQARIAAAPALTAALLDGLYGDREALAATNFYARLSKDFTMAPSTHDALRRANARLNERMGAQHEDGGLRVGRPTRPVLEQFEESKKESKEESKKESKEESKKESKDRLKDVDVVANGAVPGFLTYAYGGRQKIFAPRTRAVEGVVLKVGDRVLLSHQPRAAENGAYIVVPSGSADGSEHWVSARALGASTEGDARTLEEGKNREGTPKKSEVTATYRDGALVLQGVRLPLLRSADGQYTAGWRVGDAVVLPSLGNDLGYVSALPLQGDSNRTKGGNATGIGQTEVIVPRGSANGGVGHCVTDETIKNRAQCESALDAFGRPKAQPDVWDAPCAQDTECPFFQANKRYPNYRGGCQGGYCEMPLGVQRVGFTRHVADAESFPLCHGCPPSQRGQRECCANSKDPDYAFELDGFERAAQGL
jgi:hypothetical protein